jgi:hypothetical protein
MRDLIDKITYIAEERTLSAGTIIKYAERFDKFLLMIRNGIPFYTVDKEPVIADPTEADRFQDMFDKGQFKGNIKIKLDGSDQALPLSNLLKTKDLGGQASTGEEGEETGKEAALLKPSQIGITDRDIPAVELGDAIISNETLQSTDYGRVVIQMAEEIMNGRNPTIPKEIPTKIRASIVDYAGEYLGVLALVNGTSRFPRRQGFEKWLGNDVSSLVINFPSKSNNNIADSFASIKNAETDHTVNISSKGKGGGAPPSVGGLKIPQEIRDNPAYEASVAFIDLCDSSKQAKYNLPEPRTISQVFQAMNLLYQYVPDAIPEKFSEFLPWNIDIVNQVVDSMAAFKQRKNLPMSKYSSLWSDIDFKKPSSDGGKLTHAVKLAVMQAVNEGDALPEFQDVILAILDMNFIQQYADYDAKSRTMSFATQWPAKLEGKITLESKSGATDPTKGGFSFKLSNTDPKTVLPEPNELGVGMGSSGPSEKEFAAGAEKIATGRATTDFTSEPDNTVGDVGRKKRK